MPTLRRSDLLTGHCGTRHGWGILFGDMDIDTSTAVGKMQLSMFASVARFERDRISERTREALAVKRAQGVRLGRPATLPPEIVSRIVAERDAGSSLRTIADGLTRDGISTAQGGQAWYASTVRKVLVSHQADAVLKYAFDASTGVVSGPHEVFFSQSVPPSGEDDEPLLAARRRPKLTTTPQRQHQHDPFANCR